MTGVCVASTVSSRPAPLRATLPGEESQTFEGVSYVSKVFPGSGFRVSGHWPPHCARRCHEKREQLKDFVLKMAQAQARI